HVLRDRQRRRCLGLLRDEGDEPGDGTAAETASVPSVEQHLPLVPGEAGERAQGRSLPGAVRADEGRPAAALGPERELPHGGDGPEAHPQVACLDHAAPFDVRRTTAKNGAPQNAVTTPIGSSAGESSVRASTSARTRKPAPATSERGTTAR